MIPCQLHQGGPWRQIDRQTQGALRIRMTSGWSMATNRSANSRRLTHSNEEEAGTANTAPLA